MDNLLIPLLNVRNEQEREQRLDELLTTHVAPIIRQVLRRQLGFYVSAQGTNHSNHDAEDLYQEMMMRMVQVLDAPQRYRTIESFEAYTRSIVSHICVDFLRSRYPERARLKNALRDIFRRHQTLASWQYQNEILCGFAVWRNTGRRGGGDEVDTKLDAFLSGRFAHEDVKVVPLSRTVTELFDWLGGPVQIDELVRMLVYVLEIKEQQIESLDSQVGSEFEVNFSNSTRSTQSDLETNEILGQLWRILKRMPPRQRDVYALRFSDPAGRDLFTVLLAAGIADLNELAEGLGRSVADVVRLWTQMPMDSATTAIALNTSRKNVYKRRFLATRRLKAEFT